MFIAQELRKKSTAEFVLYMWRWKTSYALTDVSCRA